MLRDSTTDTFADRGHLAEHLDLVPGAQGGKLSTHLGAKGLQGLHHGVVLNLALLLESFELDGMRLQIGRYHILDRLPQSCDDVRHRSLSIRSYRATTTYTIEIATPSNPRVFLSAGEASGEHYGAQAIAELRARWPGASFFGLGGAAMERAGLDRVVRAEDVAVMGITEVIRHMPRIYREYRRLVSSIKARRPDVAVLIDFPDVNFRLAKHCRRLGIPVVWFVSPQLWAWKRRRLRWVQERVDRMLVIFPFEEAFYKGRGVEAEFVGHPLAISLAPEVPREEYARQATAISQDQWWYAGPDDPDSRAPQVAGLSEGNIRYELDPKREWIALLPGSRIGEVRSHLRAMIDAADELGDQYEYLVPVAETITEDELKSIMYDTGDFYLPGPRPPRITFIRNAPAAMFHARASVVASGTATVQAAMIGNPFVVVYRVSPLTFTLAKRLVTYPKEIPAPLDEHGNLPIAMVNLIAGKRVVPELLQEQFTGANVAAALRPLLVDGPQRATMMAELATVRVQLTPPDGAVPIQRVCDAVQSLVSARGGMGGEKPFSVV